ncbi:MAG: c-type cytochrome [Gemmataceae bacterium]
MANSNIKPVPPAWVEALAPLLATADGELERQLLETARALPLEPARAKPLVTRLEAIIADGKRPAETRLRAVAATPGGPGTLSPEVFRLAQEALDREGPVGRRALAVDVLTRAALSREQLLGLCDALGQTGPMELERLLDVFTRSTDERVGMRLLAALRSAPARSALRVDGVRTRLAKYPPAVLKDAERLYAELDADRARQREQLEKLVRELKPGDIRRGQAVFNSQKAACASCHAIGYLGGKIGPDLTRIGQIRSERDLLEAILYPSASFVRSYEPVTVTTAAGKVVNGLVRKDAPDEMVLTVSATEEVRIPRGEIDDVQPGKVSIMPAGLEKVLTEQELADLVAFLRAAR